MQNPTVQKFDPRNKKIREGDCDELIADDTEESIKQPIRWFSTFAFLVLHVIAVYTLIFRAHELKLSTTILHVAFSYVALLSVTAGAHRLWSHRSYAAKLPLKILLATGYLMVGHPCIPKWVKLHRVHHKFTDTCADPHDASRGFFYSHIGWLMVKRHPACVAAMKKIDMSDIESDPVLQWFTRYYPLKMNTVSFIIPGLVIRYVLGEPWDLTIISIVTRFIIDLHIVLCVNSLAHMVGNKPYNKNFRATDNAGVAMITLGEGWHNYHHAFPLDYKAAEFPNYGLNPTTGFIDLMSSIGWAYNLKSPRKDIIEKLCLNKGDGTASTYGFDYHRKKREEIQKTQ